MTSVQWSHTLILIGGLASLLIAIVYIRTGAKVRKQGRRLGWFTTLITIVGIAAILYVAFHGDAFQLLFSHAHSDAWFASTGTASASAPIAHATAAVHRHVSHTRFLVTPHGSVQQIVAHAPQQHLSISSPSHPLPLLVTLEGIASIIGIILVLCILLTALALLMRHLRQRREDAFLDAPSVGCAVCGQEGEFPSYRDRKGQLAHLCHDCVTQFQVTPIA